MKPPLRFNGKVCFVTGGGSGIGRATCERFAAEGGKVVVVNRSEKSGNETVAAIKSAGGEAIFVSTDVSVSQQVERAVRSAIENWGRIDVLVNNAAMMTYKPLTELSVEEWDRVQGVNLRGAFLCAKFTMPYMEGGAIVNVSSIHAHETTPNVIPYSTSKAGLEALTRGLSRECAPLHMRVNTVAPGAVDTPMLWDNPNIKSGAEKVDGEIGKPDDIAAAILFLASEEARFINGATLIVDGGRLNIL